MEEPRKGVFEAIRDARESAGKPRAFNVTEVAVIDDLLDRLGVPRDGEAPELPLTGLRTSEKAKALIKRCEGLKLTAYLCPAGVWTIGYGATGPGIRKGVAWSIEQAEARFARDLAEVEQQVHFLLAGRPCTQGQWDALVSFTYNCGADIDDDTKAEGLGDSTLLKKHLAGDYAGAANEFGKWIYGGGRKLAGLVTRRAEEAAMYRGEI